MQGLESYKVGTKNNWRRWCWGKVDDHVEDKQLSTILYLAGPDDLDREVALSKGFHPRCLIGVDAEDDHVRAVRRGDPYNGPGVAVGDDLSALIAAWPEDWHIDAILADYCAGLGRSPDALLNACAASAAVDTDTLLVCNLQRGRDPYSNKLRKALYETVEAEGYDMHADYLEGVPVKHRGLQMWFWMISMAQNQLGLEFDVPPDQDMINRVESGKLAFNSYCASNVTMDSIFCVWPIKSSCPEINEDEDWFGTVKHKIAAARARRTQLWGKV